MAEPHPKQVRYRGGKPFMILPASCYSSLLPYQIPQVKTVLMEKIFPNDPPTLIVDATAHIGGDTIHFAQTFPEVKVIALDVDTDAIECLNVNAQTHECADRISSICVDATEWILSAEAKVADLYYFDPPWGGPNYYNKKQVFLHLGGKHIADVILTLLERGLTKKVLLKIPRNFAYADFVERISKGTIRGVAISLENVMKPQKRGVVAYGLIFLEARVA